MRTYLIALLIGTTPLAVAPARALAQTSRNSVAPVRVLVQQLIANYALVRSIEFQAVTTMNNLPIAGQGKKAARNIPPWQKSVYKFFANGDKYRITFQFRTALHNGAALDCTCLFDGRQFEIYSPSDDASPVIYKRPPAMATKIIGPNPILRPLMFLETVSSKSTSAAPVSWRSLHDHPQHIMQSFLARFRHGGVYRHPTHHRGAQLIVSAGSLGLKRPNLLYRVRFSRRTGYAVKRITLCESHRALVTYTFTYRRFEAKGQTILLPVRIIGNSVGLRKEIATATTVLAHLHVNQPIKADEFTIKPISNIPPMATDSPAQIQRRLELRQGNSDYLPAYGALTRLLFGPHGLCLGANGTMMKASTVKHLLHNPRVIKYLRFIESKIVRGTGADMLFDELLRTLTLTGRAAVPALSGSVRDGLNDRMIIVELMFLRSQMEWKRSRESGAFNYFRCAVFLRSQDHADTPPGPDLFFRFAHDHFLPDAVYLPLRRWQEANLVKCAAFSLQLDQFSRLAASRTAGKAYVMDHLSALWQAAQTDLRYQYQLLQMVRKLKGRAVRSHRQQMVNLIDTLQTRWREQVAGNRQLGKIERAAVIRWIGEVSNGS